VNGQDLHDEQSSERVIESAVFLILFTLQILSLLLAVWLKGRTIKLHHISKSAFFSWLRFVVSEANLLVASNGSLVVRRWVENNAARIVVSHNHLNKYPDGLRANASIYVALFGNELINADRAGTGTIMLKIADRFLALCLSCKQQEPFEAFLLLPIIPRDLFQSVFTRVPPPPDVFFGQPLKQQRKIGGR
jgi:hypothetical protein